MIPFKPAGAVLHGDIRWNPELQEWFCASCGRTSDHTKLEDAQEEMENFRCELPFVEVNTQRKNVRILDLRIVTWLDTVPAIGECIGCGRQFNVPATVEKVEDALDRIRRQFVEHKCEPDASTFDYRY